jgi:hypothetical protein
MKTRYRFLQWITLNILLIVPAVGEEVIVNTAKGERFVFNIDPSESLKALEEKIVALSADQKKSFVIEFSDQTDREPFCMPVARNEGAYLGYPRNYNQEVSHEEKADIRFIVVSLADKSLISIGFAKNALEAAGNRILHIHPLRFLMAVFTDEELKVGIRNIRGRGWIWHQFVGGIKESLMTEASIGNMKEAFIDHFAQSIQVNLGLILPVLSNHKWDDFIDILITHIPRRGDHDRFDS